MVPYDTRDLGLGEKNMIKNRINHGEGSPAKAKKGGGRAGRGGDSFTCRDT
jgi:hypothetical protein